MATVSALRNLGIDSLARAQRSRPWSVSIIGEFCPSKIKAAVRTGS
jgi:hypothetical protein